MLEHALALAARGFYVFPLVGGSKLPLIPRWQDRATRDPAQIRRWWTCPVTGYEQDHNIGICTTRFGDDKALLVVDVDNKNGKSGDASILKLEIEGNELPETYTQATPTGGRHLVYTADAPVKNSAGALGAGLDVRSRGGFIVGSGSSVVAGRYVHTDRPLAAAPAWLVEVCGRAPGRVDAPAVDTDQVAAQVRAIEYLKLAPPAVQGAGGNHATFKVAAKLKDIGASENLAVSLMLDFWNERCAPPWSADELSTVVHNAYRYGASAPGSAAPEAHFDPVRDKTGAVPPSSTTNVPDRDNQAVLHPFEKLNKEYAFVLAGGGHHILWETKDAHGRFKLEHLAEPSFHRANASYVMEVGESKIEPVTKLWMNNKSRRSYGGICFMPGGTAPAGWYNLWRGFAVAPAAIGTESAESAVAAWQDHLLKNVCRGDAKLAHWLTGYFAHLVQRPSEKPLVAPVLRGGKGVGKNALVELGMHGILGGHSMVVTDRRYLVGNFNGHLENLLLLTLDEAFWSGDKQAEGILKGLITGTSHVIERKGCEPYTVENRCRVIIIGNEDWLVPASHDERRFAVFDVGEGRKNDRAFFGAMQRGMEAGGFGLLLDRLLKFDLSTVDINAAPSTQGLLDQKTATLEPFHQWWFDCLSEGQILSSEFGSAWPLQIDKDRFRLAFSKYLKERNVRARTPDERSIGRMLVRCAPSVTTGKRREGDSYPRIYKMQPLSKHREEWETYIGHKVTWNVESD